MQKNLKQNLLIYVIGFSILGFVIGESVGQYLENNIPENDSHKAFGLVDTTVHPPFLSTIPPNYWKVPQPVIAQPVISATPFKVIGIVLSKTCIDSLQTKGNSSCPSYKTIINKDNSDYWVSGSFGYVNGFYERLPTHVKQSFAWYNTKTNLTVLVDPPKDIIDKIPIIEIYSTLPMFADKHGTDLESINGNRTLHQYRFVTDCKSLISIAYTPQILDDTISYVQSGCTKTSLVTEIKIAAPITKTDPTTSANWKYQQALKLAKTISTKDCRYVKCDVSVSGKKW